jgi:hypothetical protein
MNIKMKEQSWIRSHDCGMLRGSRPQSVRPRLGIAAAPNGQLEVSRTRSNPGTTFGGDLHIINIKNEGTKLDQRDRLRNPPWFTCMVLITRLVTLVWNRTLVTLTPSKRLCYVGG